MLELWNILLYDPMINVLVGMSKAFGGSFGLALIGLTMLLNIILLPLTIRQYKSTHAMQSLQPKLQEIREKYPKDKAKVQQETMRLYKEFGANPLGCLLPMVVNLIIWFALYRAIMQTLASTPEALLGLSRHLYSWEFIQQAIPPSNVFLSIDLAQPNFPLVVLIMVTMWLTQKMSMVSSGTAQQQQMNKMMLWMFPLMFGFIFMTFPSGLALYIVVANVFRMFVQRMVMGDWGGLATLRLAKAPAGAAPNEMSKEASKATKTSSSPIKNANAKQKKRAAMNKDETSMMEKGVDNGNRRAKRKKRR